MSPDTEIAPTVRLECAAVGRVRAHEYQVSSEAAIRAAEANVSVQPKPVLAWRAATPQRLASVAAAGRTQGKRRRADVRLGGRPWPARQLYKVKQPRVATG